MKKLIKLIVEQACRNYGDVDVCVSQCLEEYFVNDLNINCDDAFDLAGEIAEMYYVIMFGK